MKKAAVFITLTVTLVVAFTFNCRAQGEGFLEASGAGELFESLDGETRELMGKLGIDGIKGDELFRVSFSSVFSVCRDVLTMNLRRPLLFMFKLLGVLILITAARSAGGGLGSGSDMTELFGVMLTCVLCASEVSDCLNAVVTSVQVSHRFLLTYVPVFAVLVSVSGSAATALTYNTAVLSAAELISAAGEGIFVPCAGIFMSLSIAFSLNSTLNAQKLAAAVNKAIFFFVGAAASLFAGMLTLKGVMSVGADSMASRGVRMLLSSFVPVVGGAISEAYSSVLGSLGLIKGTVAAFGVAAIVLVNLPVLMQAALSMLSLNLLSFFAESMNQQGMSSVFRCMSSTLRIVTVLLVLEIFLVVISTGVIITLRGSV